MIRDFMEGAKDSNDLELLKCLGELEILKAKMAEILPVGEGEFEIGEITIKITCSHIVLRKTRWEARIKNRVEHTPLLFQAYWLLFSNQGEKLVVIGGKDEN